MKISSRNQATNFGELVALRAEADLRARIAELEIENAELRKSRKDIAVRVCRLLEKCLTPKVLAQLKAEVEAVGAWRT